MCEMWAKLWSQSYEFSYSGILIKINIFIEKKPANIIIRHQ